MQLLEDAKNKRSELAAILARVESQLKSPPKGNLCVSKSHRSFQYYRSDKGHPNKRYYLDKSKRNIAVALAQRDYNRKLLKELSSSLLDLDKFISAYKPQNFLDCYEKLPQARKLLIKPAFINNSEYARLWQKKEYVHKPLEPDGTYLTLKNEKVRSKSEIIIANLLKEHGIPYHYEFPVTLKNGQGLYPDFLCLNVRTRQEFYWEHCGKMSDPEYTSNMTRRLRQFADAGIIIGRNLILTMETDTAPLSTREVEQVIRTFLLDSNAT